MLNQDFGVGARRASVSHVAARSESATASGALTAAPRVGSLAAVATFVGGVLTATADAGFVATFQSYGAGQNVSCGYRSSDAWNSTASMNLYSIRAFQHQFVGPTGAERLTWCVELYQSITLGSIYNFTEVPVESVPTSPPGAMGVTRATIVRDLFARWIDPATQLVVGDPTDRAAKSAAFQLALWEVTQENFSATDAAGMVSQMSLGQGAFRSSPTSTTTGWYDAIRASLGVGGFQSVSVGGLAHDTAQDQVYGPRVPAPGAVALLAVAGLGIRRRRRDGR
jgi:hypothetical protein